MVAPEARRFEAPAHWRAIDLLSDLHLDEAHPRTFEAWRRHLLDTPADAVLLLGDIFEAWVGDDARHEGFEQRCAEVLGEAARRRWVGFMWGNRDFLVGDEMLDACGVHRLHDPTLLQAWGRSWLLTHGDALCLADTAYQQFRAMVRNPSWQQAMLARPLAERRALARQLRDMSDAGHASRAPGDWADVDAPAAVEWLRAAGASTMIHGHTHRPGRNALAPGFERVVLSDWDLDGDTPRGEVVRLHAGGFERLAPAAASAA